MDAILSLLPSDEPTRVPVPGFEDHSPQPVFLLPPETDRQFQKACLVAKTATSRATSIKGFHKDAQKRAMIFAEKWVNGTDSFPVQYQDDNGEITVKELSDIPNWKKHPKIVPKLLALGEKYHEKETVDEDEEGNFLDEQ